MKHNFRHTDSPFRIAMIAFICLALTSLTVVMSASAGDVDGREAFRKGKADLEAGRYAEAVTALTIAQKEFGILADYALYYRADAHHNLREYTKALEAIRILLQQYPSSVLKKKARMAEIREAKDCSGEDTLKLYETYVRDFPDDDEAQFVYGTLLKKNDERPRASAIFKRLYIRAGRLAAAARAELSVDEITTADTIERTSNLIKMYDYEDAERELRHALARCNGKDRQELLKNLAYVLFRQKKYREAADVYDRVHDTYFMARSLYRAGDRKGFDAALQALISGKDKKAGFLLITVAADKRRDKDFEGALLAYQEVLKNYPAEAEEALWGIGWTQYLAGDFRKAAEIFSQLYSAYSDPKYLYWQARSVDASGDDASSLYARITTADNGFYAALAYAKSRKPIPTPASATAPLELSREKSQSQERIETLISLDMRGEAITELSALCRQLSSPSDLLYSASTFQGLGEFKRAITLVTKLPYSEKLHRFWYPLAFWDTVEHAAGRNGLDPYVILSVMREESRFDQAVKSPAGAYGLMQLMPQTAYRLDRKLNLGINRPAQLTDPVNNISLGSYYLKVLSDEFHSLPYVLAAYNAGELAVRSWQERFAYRTVDEFIEDIPYAETRNYVKKVITSYYQYKRFSTPGWENEKSLDIILGRL